MALEHVLYTLKWFSKEENLRICREHMTKFFIDIKYMFEIPEEQPLFEDDAEAFIESLQVQSERDEQMFDKWYLAGVESCLELFKWMYKKEKKAWQEK